MTVLPLVYEGLLATPYAEADYTILMNRNHDGTPFKQIVIQHVLIHKSEQPTPLALALAGLVKPKVV